MVLATIQTNKEDVGITTINGVVVTGDDEEEVLIKISKKIGYRNLNKSGNIKSLNIKDKYCILQHPELNNVGKRGELLLIWSINDSEEIIKKTINIMGCNFDDWKKEHKKYKYRTIRNMALGVAVLTAASAILKAYFN